MAVATATACALLQDARASWLDCADCLESQVPVAKAKGRRRATVVLKGGDGGSSTAAGSNFKPAVAGCAHDGRLMMPLLSTRTKPARQAFNVEAVVVTENWLGSHKIVTGTVAEEAMALARVAAKAARDAEAYAQAQAGDYEDFFSEKDLLRLKRARLSEMERTHMLQLEVEGDALRTQINCETHMGRPMGKTASLTTVEDETTSAALEKGTTQDIVIVRSTRRFERLLRRERALEKAGRVAATIASTAHHVRPKKTQISRDLSNPVRAFLREIGQHKLLTATEEVELSKGIKDLLKMDEVRNSLMEQLGREPTMGEWACAAGMDQKAFERRIKEGWFCKDKMVNSNLALVVSIAKKYQGRGMTLQDLIQEGSMGLIRGAEKFDHHRGYKFSTYAHWWIRQALTRAIADQTKSIRLPVHWHDVITRIKKAKHMFIQEHGRKPHDHEAAKLVGMTVGRMKAVLQLTRAPISMERPLSKEGETTIGELLPDRDIESPEDVVAKQQLKQDIDDLLHTLDQRERDVVRLRYGFDDGRMRTLEELGCKFRITRERVRQLESRALRKLRQPSRNCVLRKHLDL